jgi:acyl homoserine lactone synthase
MLGSVRVASRSDLSHAHEYELACYRHQIFVERLGWALADGVMQDGCERDQFDTAQTVYVIRRNSRGDICGCARLLPTIGPYLLKEIFPALFTEGDLPSLHQVWELSRLAATAGDAVGTSKEDVLDGVRVMMRAVVGFAAERGIQRLIGVTYVAMERLFRRLGIHAHRAGAPQLIDGKLIVACWIEIDIDTRRALGFVV